MSTYEYLIMTGYLAQDNKRDLRQLDFVFSLAMSYFDDFKT